MNAKKFSRAGPCLRALLRRSSLLRRAPRSLARLRFARGYRRSRTRRPATWRCERYDGGWDRLPSTWRFPASFPDLMADGFQRALERPGIATRSRIPEAGFEITRPHRADSSLLADFGSSSGIRAPPRTAIRGSGLMVSGGSGAVSREALERWTWAGGPIRAVPRQPHAVHSAFALLRSPRGLRPHAVSLGFLILTIGAPAPPSWTSFAFSHGFAGGNSGASYGNSGGGSILATALLNLPRDSDTSISQSA